MSFTGVATPNGVQLSWTTASERHHAGFDLRRSLYQPTQPETWQTIASYSTLPELRSKGTTNSLSHYAFLDGTVEKGKTYIYQLRSTDFDGTWYDHALRVTVRVPELSSALNYDYRLEQNYPNPFNPSTSIRFTMKEAGSAILVVTDVLGRVVFREILNAKQGENEYQFRASNLGSGMYFYTLYVSGFQQTRKMMLIK